MAETLSIFESRLLEFNIRLEAAELNQTERLNEIAQKVENSNQLLNRAQSFLSNPLELSFSNPLFVGGITILLFIGVGIY